MPKVNAEISALSRSWASAVERLGLLWGLGWLVGRGLCMDSFVIDSSQFDCFWFIGSFFCCLFTALLFWGVVYIVFSTESLILAQDERWRRA